MATPAATTVLAQQESPSPQIAIANAADISVIVIYFLVVLVVGLWVSASFLCHHWWGPGKKVEVAFLEDLGPGTKSRRAR